jgi:hypothetical protein
MNFKYTPHTLLKIEQIFDDAGYLLRYEKGTFNSGYCILEERKVVVINKFLDTEGRINTLCDILPTLRLQEELLSAESLKLYRQINQTEANAADGGMPADITGEI